MVKYFAEYTVTGTGATLEAVRLVDNRQVSPERIPADARVRWMPEPDGASIECNMSHVREDRYARYSGHLSPSERMERASKYIELANAAEPGQARYVGSVNDNAKGTADLWTTPDGGLHWVGVPRIAGALELLTETAIRAEAEGRLTACPQSSTDAPWDCISNARDRKIAELWHADMTCTEIAAVIDRNPKTVANRVTELRKAFGEAVIPYRLKPKG